MWYLIVFFISMVPIVEIRGAVPVAVANDLNLFWTYVICILGNMLPVPIIYLFARKVLVWGSDKKFIGRFFSFCLEKGEKGGRKLEAKAGNVLFVGIPLPGTGAWTGTLAASILDLGFKKSVIAVMCGVVIAGIIMGIGSVLVANGINFIFAP